MPAAVQTAAVTAWQSAALSTNPSLTTVEATLVLSTQSGTRSDAGCVVPGLPGWGDVVLLTSAAGGVRPARRMVANATASLASREMALYTVPHWYAGRMFSMPPRL